MIEKITEIETLWADLLTQAVLGTERSAQTAGVAPPLDDESPLHHLLQNIHQAGSIPERTLLESAAALSLYRRAGSLPVPSTGPLPPACPADDRPACSPAAGKRLAYLLTGKNPKILSEWLALANRAGVRIPDALLPAALDLGVRSPEHIEALLPVLGTRGVWLAGQSQRWDYAAVSGDLEAGWQTGTPQQRSRLLRRLRSEWPEEAQRLLASTWEQDYADERADFLAALDINLSPADEPFLETALDDRAAAVRRVAAGLLCRLPGSRLIARMVHRADNCLAYEPGRWPLQRSRLLVRLPQACDQSMRRDGIDPKPRAGTGERAWWLAQIVSAVPPEHWSRRWNVTPEELLLRLGESEWEALILDALCKATARHPSAAWVQALLDVDAERPELIEALPPAEAEACLIRALHRRKNGGGLWMAAHYRKPWSSRLTAAVIEYLHRHAALLAATPTDWSALRSVEGLGLWMDPTLHDYAERWLRTEAEAASPLEKSFNALLETLAFRLEMHKELS